MSTGCWSTICNHRWANLYTFSLLPGHDCKLRS